MTRKPCVVIDTSVLISAVITPKGKPRQAVSHLLTHGTLIASAATFDEVATRLKRPKFQKYVRPQEVDAFLRLIQGKSQFITITETITACRDPKDNKFLELAVSGSADMMLSSDGDLLALHPFRGIPILAPATYLDMLKAG